MDKIVANNLQKKRGKFAVIDDVSFSVHEGEIFALVGDTKSGKSLVTKIIQNLAVASGGSASVENQDTSKGLRKAAKKTGMVISDQTFHKNSTPQKTLKYYLNLNAKQTARGEFANILNLLGLKKIKNIAVERLKPNEITRLKLAAAVISKPSVLILDEPFNGLNPQEFRAVNTLIKTLADKNGVAVLLTSKDMYSVESICDTIAIIDDGQIISIRSYNDYVGEIERFDKLCISTPTPNLTAKIVEIDIGYAANICGSDVIADTSPSNAQDIYDELMRQGVTVYGMSKVHKSIQELYYDFKMSMRRVEYAQDDGYGGGYLDGASCY